MDAYPEFIDQISHLRDRRTVVLGIGNTLKGDDGAGPAVCELLKDKTKAEVIDAGMTPENYIGVIVRKAPQHLLVVDAMNFSAKPGTVRVFRPEQLDAIVLSTHSLSPRWFTEMIASEIDVEVLFVGVEPEQMELGQGLSKTVRKAVSLLSHLLLSLLGKVEDG